MLSEVVPLANTVANGTSGLLSTTLIDGSAGDPGSPTSESDFVFPTADRETDGGRSPDEPTPAERKATNVLLFGPLYSASETDQCVELCSTTPTAATQVLFIEVGPSSEDRIEQIGRRFAGGSAPLTVLIVGGSAVAGPWRGMAREREIPLEVKRVADATDLGRIGLSISKAISKRETAETVVCLHSVTELNARVEDSGRVFRFLHILTDRLEDAGAMAHYHLDPAACSEQFQETVRPLFDRFVRVDRERSTD